MRKNNKLLNLCIMPLIALGLILTLSGCGEEQTLTLDEITAEAQPNDASGLMSAETAQPGTTDSTDHANTATAPFFVYVCGAVVNPGVYELPQGSRICDALDAAGGFTEGADVNRINLAGSVTDGMMIFFPEVGEEIPDGVAAGAGSATGEKQDTGLVNINTAGEAQLCTLPGIGESKAKAIIEYREEHGPFADKSDIKNVSGIGDSLYRKIEDLICI